MRLSPMALPGSVSLLVAFEIVSDTAVAEHLKSYGDTARYMMRAAAESAL